MDWWPCIDDSSGHAKLECLYMSIFSTMAFHPELNRNHVRATVYAPPPGTSFFPLTLFISIPKLTSTANPPVAIASRNALTIAFVYASKTPASNSLGTTFRTYVAPALITTCGSRPGAYVGSSRARELTKMFCAMEIAIAPPRLLKNMTQAFAVGISF
jgi:hypothetical protein